MGMCPFFHVPVLDYHYALLMMVLPQLIRSIMSIIYSFPYYIKVIEKWLNSFVEHGWKLNPEMLDMINQYSAKHRNILLPIFFRRCRICSKMFQQVFLIS